jgi:uncharacterized protein YggE
MRREWWRVGSLLLGSLVVVLALWQPNRTLAENTTPLQRTLEVSGMGLVKTTYDTATITLGVTTVKESPSAAYSSVGQTADAIVAALRKQGVETLEMKTSQLSLNAEYDWQKEGAQRLIGYRAATNLTITTQALDKVAVFVQAAVDAGANQLQGVSFSLKDAGTTAQIALTQATDDARAKADIVAKRLKTEVIGVTKVTVGSSNNPGPIPYYSGMTKSAADSAIPVLSGSFEYTANVTITFELR